ncbi:MAG: DUF1992 domain-containing protein [Deltaproteobacteria bacterium]|nr:MAG: DUF1992 domain-containing protein [Deltaproteobacteria bacterium]
MAWSFFQRVVEERILEAQRAGVFDNLPGKGKPLELDDQSWVPEELRVAYHVLKNAHVLPPEAELLKEIHGLEDLLKYIDEEEGRKAALKSIQSKLVRLDLLRRRSLPLETVRYYGGKLVRKFR